MPRISELKTHHKIIIGALGGVSAVCVKFLGQDYTILIQQGANLNADQWFAFKVGYIILTPILIFLGALLAWVCEESSRVKLLAIAVAAPAMITTWSGGAKQDEAFALASLNIISSAHAVQATHSDLAFHDPTKRSTMSWWDAGVSGVNIFFGYGKEIKRYYVVVGSFKKQSRARRHAREINNRDSSLFAYPGGITQNGYYPVLLGEAATLSEANSLKNKIVGQRIVPDAFLVSAKSVSGRSNILPCD